MKIALKVLNYDVRSLYLAVLSTLGSIFWGSLQNPIILISKILSVTLYKHS